MNNTPNRSGLISLADRSPEERKEIARKGGQASGQKRRDSRLMKDILNTFLNLSMKKGKICDIDSLTTIEGIEKKNLTLKDMIMFKQLEKALEGDIRSAMFIRDTIGEGSENVLDFLREEQNEESSSFMENLYNALINTQVEGVDYELDQDGNRIPIKQNEK